MISILCNFVKFPLWKNDGKAVVKLNKLQKRQLNTFLQKIDNKEYNFIENVCLCGSINKDLNILISQKDRYGITCNNILCKKCGLIRLKERLDDKSTAKFYKNEYRDIYVGEELASDCFFNSQVKRGEIFFDFIDELIDIKEIESVFEIGCGAGGILYSFYKNSKKVSGCDFGKKYLSYGQEKGLNLYQGEIDFIKTPKESQDLIILSHVMEHFNEPLKTMGEIIEFIKPNKYLLVEVPGIFNIPKTYFNPILYFQNAHVYNYYYYYLKVFFESLGLEVVYGNERCTFLLKKPINWTKKDNISIKDEELNIWSKKIENKLKIYYLIHLVKLNPYYLKIRISEFLDFLGIKTMVKRLLCK